MLIVTTKNWSAEWLLLMLAPRETKVTAKLSTTLRCSERWQWQGGVDRTGDPKLRIVLHRDHIQNKVRDNKG